MAEISDSADLPPPPKKPKPTRRKSHKFIPMNNPLIKKKRLNLPPYPYLSDSEPDDIDYPFEPPKTAAAQARIDKCLLKAVDNPKQSTSGPLVRERIRQGFMINKNSSTVIKNSPSGAGKEKSNPSPRKRARTGSGPTKKVIPKENITTNVRKLYAQ